jgi:hypothetical protein
MRKEIHQPAGAHRVDPTVVNEVLEFFHGFPARRERQEPTSDKENVKGLLKGHGRGDDGWQIIHCKCKKNQKNNGFHSLFFGGGVKIERRVKKIEMNAKKRKKEKVPADARAHTPKQKNKRSQKSDTQSLTMRLFTGRDYIQSCDHQSDPTVTFIVVLLRRSNV